MYPLVQVYCTSNSISVDHRAEQWHGESKGRSEQIRTRTRVYQVPAEGVGGNAGSHGEEFRADAEFQSTTSCWPWERKHVSRGYIQELIRNSKPDYGGTLKIGVFKFT